MPGVAFCNINEIFSTPWEKKHNQRLMKKLNSVNQGMDDAENCNDRNNNFQNDISKDQFGLAVNPLNMEQSARDATFRNSAQKDAQSLIIQPQPQQPLRGHSPPEVEPIQQPIQQPQQYNLQPMSYQNVDMRIPQNYPVYRQYNQWLPQRWMMNPNGPVGYDNYNPYMMPGYAVEHFEGPKTNKLLNILLLILCVLLMLNIVKMSGQQNNAL